MAITDAYASAAEYRIVTGRTGADSDAQILYDLRAISRFLEGKLERFFNVDAANVARVYVPAANSAELWIDDLSATPSSVKLDTDGDGTFATTLAATDYELLPLNAAVGPEPRPYTRIGMTPWGSYSGFVSGQRVQITGKWGWASVPSPIKQACIHLTAILRLETPRATVRVPEQGFATIGEQLETSPEAQHIIRQLTDSYRRVTYV